MIPKSETLPCGCFINCVIVDGRREMRVSPCQLNCIYLASAIRLANDKGLPVEHRVAP